MGMIQIPYKKIKNLIALVWKYRCSIKNIIRKVKPNDNCRFWKRDNYNYFIFMSHGMCPKSNRVKRCQDWEFGRYSGFFAVKCGPCFLYTSWLSVWWMKFPQTQDIVFAMDVKSSRLLIIVLMFKASIEREQLQG